MYKKLSKDINGVCTLLSANNSFELINQYLNKDNTLKGRTLP